MGLFGGKEVFVSSVVYNMAGDVIGRPDYLKTVVASNVINNSRFSMAETLSSSYLGGPGIKIRSFYRWTKLAGNYETVGVPTTTMYSPNFNMTTITAQIPVGAGETAKIQAVKYGKADYSYWAEQYVMLNHQTLFKTAWTADYNATTNQITITWAVGSTPGTPTTTFTPTIDPAGRYYYVTYGLSNGSTYLGARMWIYKMGSGNVNMDSLSSDAAVSGDFVPFIPVRIKNQFLSSTYKPEIYAQAKKAYKKATSGGKFDKLVTQLADNPDLDDIDHAYIVFGVPLNTKNNRARRYLFKFFDFMRTAQLSGSTEYGAYQTSWQNWWAEYEGIYETKSAYLINNPEGDISGDADYVNGTYEGAPAAPLNEIEIKSTGSADTKLHMVLKWGAITKTTGSGMIAPSGKVGELWWDDTIYVSGSGAVISFLNALLSQSNEAEKVALNWQTSATTWEKLTITGLKHRNEIYDSKSVKIKGADALEDLDESGFIVPIHYETLRACNLVDSTQMIIESTMLVFNCYEVVKQKWYQTGIFKIVVFVVMIAITVATGGAGAIGLLGTAGSIGASLGFTGLMATIVGAVANAIAAMILMKIIGTVSVAVLGAKIGAIIATVASVMAMSVGAGMMSGQSLAASWGNLMSATNIIGMTSAVGNGIAGYIQAGTQDILAQTAALAADYEKAAKQIQDQYLKEFGQGTFAFDPLMLTDSGLAAVGELPRMFLDRTLMTGSDVAEMSLDMLSNFSNYTLDVNTITS